MPNFSRESWGRERGVLVEAISLRCLGTSLRYLSAREERVPSSRCFGNGVANAAVGKTLGKAPAEQPGAGRK